jgi:hypothetical protein
MNDLDTSHPSGALVDIIRILRDLPPLRAVNHTLVLMVSYPFHMFIVDGGISLGVPQNSGHPPRIEISHARSPRSLKEFKELPLMC